MPCILLAHARFRILSATLLISVILAANISKYAAYAIRKDRDNEKYATHANSKVCVNSRTNLPQSGCAVVSPLPVMASLSR